MSTSTTPTLDRLLAVGQGPGALSRRAAPARLGHAAAGARSARRWRSSPRSIGPYPISPGRRAGGRPAAPDRRRAGRGRPLDTVLFGVRLPRIARGACWSAPRSPAAGRRLPEPVPQPAGLARHPGRLGGRRPRRRARHLPVAAGARHPAAGVRWSGSPRSAWSTGRRLGARPRAGPGAGAGRRGRRRARRRGHLAAQGPGRPLRPAAGDHLLAARQPRRHQARATCAATLPVVAARPRAAGAAALAHQRAVARRRGGARRWASRPARLRLRRDRRGDPDDRRGASRSPA